MDVMEYSQNQIKCIEDNIMKHIKRLKSERGLESLCTYADISVWTSHAFLAGYQVERDSGRLYKESAKTRTYFSERQP